MVEGDSERGALARIFFSVTSRGWECGKGVSEDFTGDERSIECYEVARNG